MHISKIHKHHTITLRLHTQTIAGGIIIIFLTDAELILWNDATAGISSNCSDINHILNGSYLVQVHDCHILINGELFPSTDVPITGKSYISTHTGFIAEEAGIKDEPLIEHLRNITLYNS